MTNLRHGHTIIDGRNADNPKWRTYCSWMSMKARCYNKNLPDFGNYGGRGITMCERWHDFGNFHADMGDRPAGRSLDRIDCNGNYEPGNCRWATRKEQSVNRRSARMLTFNGRTMLMQDWARFLGIGHSGLIKRLREWPLERALSERPQKREK